MSSTSQPTGVIELFYSYSHKDEELRDELENHLAVLKSEGVIKGWHDRKITAGQEWDGKIDENLNSAKIILLLVSSDFLSSKYCYDIEVKRAMERHEAGEACVIPIILRPCDWNKAVFGKLQALPKNAKPVTLWTDRDEALLDVVQGIRNAVEGIDPQTRTPKSISDETGRTTPRINIPRPPIIGFVARRDEEGRDIVERLKEELAPQKTQHVTLSGPGGVGKTTLAAEAARALMDVFNDHVVWSSAGGRADFTLSTLLDDIATQLGREDLRPLAPDAKATQVRTVVEGPPTLVVLDNYETIADEPKCKIEEWLSSTQCPALITSRHKIESTLYIKVDAMTPEEAQEFLEKVIGQTQDAKIFSKEVRARIYETAEANPYVMQWIVAQIDEAKEPGKVLEELQHGDGDAAQRVFDRSFNLQQLGDDGRAVLLALSLFAPSATREALDVVAGFGDDVKRVNDAVKNLRALWLIKAIDENRRFTTEGLTRTLARVRLEEDTGAPEFRKRFVGHFQVYVKAHAQASPEDYDALEEEKGNVLAAIDLAFELEDWSMVIEIANVVAPPYVGILSVRGYWDEAIRVGDQAVVAAQRVEDEWTVAQFVVNTATIRTNRGEYDNASRSYQQGLVAFKKLGDETNVAVVLHQLATIAHEQGDPRKARQLYDESLVIQKKLGNQKLIAIGLHQLGMLAEDEGEFGEARRLYDESLEIKKKLGNQGDIALTISQIGILLRKQGKFAESKAKHEESVAIRLRLGDQLGIAIDLDSLGRLAELDGHKHEAAQLLREALDTFEKLKSPFAESTREELESLESESS